ncbi:MAG: winged helix-turn-helix domain-containing protein [Promethearchaeota archaeon]
MSEKEIDGIDVDILLLLKRHKGGLSVREITDAIKIPYGTVRNRVLSLIGRGLIIRMGEKRYPRYSVKDIEEKPTVRRKLEVAREEFFINTLALLHENPLMDDKATEKNFSYLKFRSGRAYSRVDVSLGFGTAILKGKKESVRDLLRQIGIFYQSAIPGRRPKVRLIDSIKKSRCLIHFRVNRDIEVLYEILMRANRHARDVAFDLVAKGRGKFNTGMGSLGGL